MIDELVIYNGILYGFVILGVITFLALSFISAPYGRHVRKGWGPNLSSTLGWVIMEAPAALIFAIYYIFSENKTNIVLIIFLVLWQLHYMQRSFIFPFLLRGNKRMPLSIVLMGLIFNTINTYVQGRWIFTLAPIDMYDIKWFYDPRFIIGVSIFIAGYVINRHSDWILRNLRQAGEKGYKIPYGGLYRYVSCPNYFGEILIWIGWAIATWSVAGFVFAFWTFANLFPRAYSHHKWYKETFENYPEDRKVIFPYIF